MNAFEQIKLWARYTKLTAILITLSVLVALISNFGSDYSLIHILFITEYREGLNEISSGQLWRLFTPALIHFGIMHIAFNMLWLYQLVVQSNNAKVLSVWRC